MPVAPALPEASKTSDLASLQAKASVTRFQPQAEPPPIPSPSVQPRPFIPGTPNAGRPNPPVVQKDPNNAQVRQVIPQTVPAIPNSNPSVSQVSPQNPKPNPSDIPQQPQASEPRQGPTDNPGLTRLGNPVGDDLRNLALEPIRTLCDSKGNVLWLTLFYRVNKSWKKRFYAKWKEWRTKRQSKPDLGTPIKEVHEIVYVRISREMRMQMRKPDPKFDPYIVPEPEFQGKDLFSIQ
jgi:hypothetical protein